MVRLNLEELSVGKNILPDIHISTKLLTTNHGFLVFISRSLSPTQDTASIFGWAVYRSTGVCVCVKQKVSATIVLIPLLHAGKQIIKQQMCAMCIQTCTHINTVCMKVSTNL